MAKGIKRGRGNQPPKIKPEKAQRREDSDNDDASAASSTASNFFSAVRGGDGSEDDDADAVRVGDGPVTDDENAGSAACGNDDIDNEKGDDDQRSERSSESEGCAHSDDRNSSEPSVSSHSGASSENTSNPQHRETEADQKARHAREDEEDSKRYFRGKANLPARSEHAIEAKHPSVLMQHIKPLTQKQLTSGNIEKAISEIASLISNWVDVNPETFFNDKANDMVQFQLNAGNPQHPDRTTKVPTSKWYRWEYCTLYAALRAAYAPSATTNPKLRGAAAMEDLLRAFKSSGIAPIGSIEMHPLVQVNAFFRDIMTLDQEATMYQSISDKLRCQLIMDFSKSLFDHTWLVKAELLHSIKDAIVPHHESRSGKIFSLSDVLNFTRDTFHRVQQRVLDDKKWEPVTRGGNRDTASRSTGGLTESAKLQKQQGKNKAHKANKGSQRGSSRTSNHTLITSA